jgi:hypothetical protein
MYIGGIHAGIQSAHAVADLLSKHPKDKSLKQWATKDKTLIVKAGGDSNDIKDIVKLFKNKANPYSWALFKEPDLENVVTAVAICVPEHIYVGKGTFTGFDEKLVALIKRCPLAR